MLSGSDKPLSIKEMNNLLKNKITQRTFQNKIKLINKKSEGVRIISVGKGRSTAYELEMNSTGGQPKPAAS